MQNEILIRYLTILPCITEIKKPAGTAEDIEKFFGCSASLLVMVGIYITYKSCSFPLTFYSSFSLFSLPGRRSAFHRYCLWKQTWLFNYLNRTTKSFRRAFHCPAGKFVQHLFFFWFLSSIFNSETVGQKTSMHYNFLLFTGFNWRIFACSSLNYVKS